MVLLIRFIDWGCRSNDGSEIVSLGFEFEGCTLILVGLFLAKTWQIRAKGLGIKKVYIFIDLKCDFYFINLQLDKDRENPIAV